MVPLEFDHSHESRFMVCPLSLSGDVCVGRNERNHTMTNQSSWEREAWKRSRDEESGWL